ncbi:MAG: hypothetical protein M3Y81_27035 [Chloroflexota bacterium]|nr:hypothetical protein [Chloroflexota bacterium]
MAALYTERVARRHLGDVPVIAGAAAGVATLFKKWDESGSTARSVARFICSGLVQYSFFEALRRRIIKAMAVYCSRKSRGGHEQPAQYAARHFPRR